MQCIRCYREIPDKSLYCNFCGKRQTSAPAPSRKHSRRPNGSGSVYKLPGSRRRPWAAVRDGVYIGYYPTKGEALTALERLSGRELRDSYNYTVEQVHACWRAEHFPTLTAKGQEMYRTAWRRVQTLKDRKMREIRTADYQRIINDMEDAGLSLSSANKVKQLASQLSKWAMREDIITTNYAQFVRLYGDAPEERESFTDEEIAALEAHAEIEAVKLILILIYTGLRIGELFKLPRDAVDLERGYLIGGSKTKAGKERTVPILTPARPHIQYFYDRGHPGERLVAGYTGNRTAENFRGRDYVRTLEELGIRPLTPHSTRHTFTSLAVRAKIQPEILRRVIGHANYSTTVEIYAHSNPEELVAEMEKLTNYLQVKKGSSE